MGIFDPPEPEALPPQAKGMSIGLFIDGPQGQLSCELQGANGTPILLVHGNGGRGSQWEHAMATLGHRHRVAALDLRGMGDSASPGNGDFSIGAFADDVAAVADAFHWPSLVLAGHSLGSSVAAACAGKWPGRVLGLILVDHGGDVRNDAPEDQEAVAQGLAPENFAAFARRAMETCLKGARPEVKARVLADLEATPSAHFAEAVMALQDFDAPFALGAYPGPKLHIHSVFLETQHLSPIHAQAPAIESILVQDCSHWIHLDQPEVFEVLLEQFVARL